MLNCEKPTAPSRLQVNKTELVRFCSFTAYRGLEDLAINALKKMNIRLVIISQSKVYHAKVPANKRSCNRTGLTLTTIILTMKLLHKFTYTLQNH